jgi:hypothetical protein
MFSALGDVDPAGLSVISVSPPVADLRTQIGMRWPDTAGKPLPPQLSAHPVQLAANAFPRASQGNMLE